MPNDGRDYTTCLPEVNLPGGKRAAGREYDIMFMMFQRRSPVGKSVPRVGPFLYLCGCAAQVSYSQKVEPCSATLQPPVALQLRGYLAGQVFAPQTARGRDAGRADAPPSIPTPRRDAARQTIFWVENYRPRGLSALRPLLSQGGRVFGRKVIKVWEYERGLLYQKGRFEKLLEPGQYVLWPWQSRHIDRVDIRETSQTVDGQEILTSDKVGVRVTLVAQYKVHDPVAARHTVESYTSQLYQDLQLTLRESITGRTIEQVLQDREALSTQLLQQVAPRAAKYGVTLNRVGVKDMILPGAVRNVFMQEVEADLKGRAELVAARHEIAAARARANTAKLLQENPNILRLQELETLAALASKAGNVLVIPGLQSLFSKEERKE